MVDFLVFELGDSLVVASVVDSVAGDFSVFGSDFSLFFELLFFSLGLVAVSAAGLFVVAGDLVVVAFVEGEGLIAGTGLGFTVEVAAGVMVAAADAVAAGVIVAATLAEAAGVALAFVEADVLVVVLGAVVVVVPVVVDALTPKVAGTVTP